MKITKRQLSRIIRQELINEGWLENLGHKAMSGLSKIIRPDSLHDNMSVEDAKEELFRAVLQYGISSARGGPDSDIPLGIEKAKQLVQNQKFQTE